MTVVDLKKPPQAETDKKPIVVTSPATEGFNTWLCGAGDDPSPTPPATGRGTGTPLIVSYDGAESFPHTKIVEFQFIEPVEIHDGQLSWDGPGVSWKFDDVFSLGVRMPQTPSSSTPGVGNTNKVPSGAGYDVFVPAAGSGSHTVVLADAVPVYSKGSGYWNVDYETGTITANPIGKGNWHLLDVEVTGWLIRNISMGHPGGWFDVDVYKTEYVHPNWRIRIEITKTTPLAGRVGGWLLCFRKEVR